ENLLTSKDLEKLARLWILGADIDWSILRREVKPRKVTLPTYPFAKERYWVPQAATSLRLVQKNGLDIQKAAVQPATEERHRTYYAPRWTLKALIAPEQGRAESGPVLILDSSEKLFLAMKEQMGKKSGHDPIILVKFGDSFQEVEPNI